VVSPRSNSRVLQSSQTTLLDMANHMIELNRCERYDISSGIIDKKCMGVPDFMGTNDP